MAISEKTANTTSMRNCKMTSTTSVADIANVEQSVASSVFKFGEFGANGIKTVLYGEEALPTLAISGGSRLRNADTGSLAFDARGVARDAMPDIGAFEYVGSKGFKILIY